LLPAGASSVPHTLETLAVSAEPELSYLFEARVSPDGLHVYVTSPVEDGVTVFRRDPSTQRLFWVETLAIDGPRGLAFSPDGAHLYVAAAPCEFNCGAIWTFSRNAVTGALTAVEVLSDVDVPALEDPVRVVVTPDGAHVYVSSDFSMAVFSRDGGTGALTFVQEVANFTGGIAVSPDGAYVYVTGGSEIGVFSRNAGTGMLTLVSEVEDGVGGVDGLLGVIGLAMTPDGAHLYAVSFAENSVAAFARNAGTGALTFVDIERDGVGGVDGLANALAVRTSPDGAQVYAVADYGYGYSGPEQSAVTVFSRNAGTGALTFVQLQRDGLSDSPGNAGPRNIAFSPDGAYAYVPSYEEPDGLVVYARNGGTGLLTLAANVFQPRDAALALSPDGGSAYVASPGVHDQLVLYDRDPGTGTLTYVTAVGKGLGGVDGLDGVLSVAVSPDGDHVYTAAADDDAVAAFARDAGTGVLTFVEAERDGVGGVDGLDGAQAVVLSPDGAHVYVAAGTDDALAVFSRDGGTGALTFVEAQRDGVGGVDGLDGATAVAVSPDGAHLYVAASEDDAVAVFSRDGGTGALTFVEVQRDGLAGVDGLDGARTIAASGDGAHVYVGSVGDDAIVVFARAAVTGALTLVDAVRPEGELVPFHFSNGIALSPDGQMLYGAGTSGGILHGFARDAGTGVLRFVDAAPGGRTVTPSPDGAHVYSPPQFGSAAVRTFARGFSGCDAAPLPLCRPAARANLGIVLDGARLTWRWSGDSPLATFGSPQSSTHYAFCLYDESGGPPNVVMRALVPAGDHWTLPPGRLFYIDPYGTPEGLTRVLLTPLPSGRARINLKTKGASVAQPVLPPLPLATPFRAQLQASTGECWEATYSSALFNGRALRARAD
jgi:6-phosphogluconolactonase (cycloisomerase 2 family)